MREVMTFQNMIGICSSAVIPEAESEDACKSGSHCTAGKEICSVSLTALQCEILSLPVLPDWLQQSHMGLWDTH